MTAGAMKLRKGRGGVKTCAHIRPAAARGNLRQLAALGDLQEGSHVDEDVRRSFVRKGRSRERPDPTLGKVGPRRRKVALQEPDPRRVPEPLRELVAVVPRGKDGEVERDQGPDDPHGGDAVEPVAPCRIRSPVEAAAAPPAVVRSVAAHPRRAVKRSPGESCPRRRGLQAVDSSEASVRVERPPQVQEMPRGRHQSRRAIRRDEQRCRPARGEERRCRRGSEEGRWDRGWSGEASK